MTYLIDGYNLLHQTLHDTADEVMDAVNEYCRREGKQAVVFFDGHAPDYDLPNANARFVGDADAELARYIRDEVTNPTAYVVVSSDKDVKFAGRDARLEVISSEAFAHRLTESPVIIDPDDEKGDVRMNDDEVARQLADFNFFKKL